MGLFGKDHGMYVSNCSEEVEYQLQHGLYYAVAKPNFPENEDRSEENVNGKAAKKENLRTYVRFYQKSQKRTSPGNESKRKSKMRHRCISEITSWKQRSLSFMVDDKQGSVKLNIP
ncbi:hypothetical protein C5167_043571 [Papaver somniferum]|uniref:Uncharacterized protein n=1 Tax=Papaver somniferum TaxID=3469 RepID=A0A4Y7L9Y6_PAPSO|nr:hypothetical protein C5167_043571 [Papaver somniferum]